MCIRDSFERHHHFLARLARLVHKRQTYRIKQPIGADPISADSAVTLFAQICGRTDELYCVTEQFVAGSTQVLTQRLLSNPELKGGIETNPSDSSGGSCVGELWQGPIKDACRLHEKGWDYYATRFNDGVLPESCVTDLTRSRLVLYDGKGVTISGVLKELKRTVDVKWGAYNVHCELLRLTNGFANLDHTRCRKVTLVFRCTFNHLEAKKGPNKAVTFTYHELEIAYAPMLQLNAAEKAPQVLERFRAALQQRYDDVKDEAMLNMLTFLARRAGHPMFANLLALTFHRDASQISERLPRGNPDIFEGAVREFLAYRLGDEEVTKAYGLLFFVADTLRSADRPVSPDDVEKKLKAISKGRGELNTWRKLYSPPMDDSPGSTPPFLAVGMTDGRPTINFTMPAFLFVFLIDCAPVADAIASSMSASL